MDAAPFFVEVRPGLRGESVLPLLLSRGGLCLEDGPQLPVGEQQQHRPVHVVVGGCLKGFGVIPLLVHVRAGHHGRGQRPDTEGPAFARSVAAGEPVAGPRAGCRLLFGIKPQTEGPLLGAYAFAAELDELPFGPLERTARFFLIGAAGAAGGAQKCRNRRERKLRKNFHVISIFKRHKYKQYIVSLS